MKKKGKANLKVTRGESFIFSFYCFVLCALFIFHVCTTSYRGNLEMNIEELKYELKNQEKKNESLNMQVNELTSFDKIKDIVKNMGLAYNNKNIIVIDKWGGLSEEEKR